MTKPSASQAPRLDLYQQVTNQIIAALEQGVRPWSKPWSADHLATRVAGRYAPAAEVTVASMCSFYGLPVLPSPIARLIG